jgi:hypothetical protein
MLARMAVTGIAFLLVIVCASRDGMCGAEEEQTHGKEVLDGDSERVDWNLLNMGFGRRVTQISIILLEKRAVPFGKGVVGPKRFEYQTGEPSVVEVMTSSLDLPLRRACPDHEGFGFGVGHYSLGTMIVTTTKDQFVVGITDGGFALGSSDWTIQNVFYSWGVARQIDDVLFEETAKRLPLDVFQALSGESFILTHKRMYELIRSRHSSHDRPSPRVPVPKDAPPDRASPASRRRGVNAPSSEKRIDSEVRGSDGRRGG